DVDNNTIVIKVLPSQLPVHDVGRAVKVLSEAKHLALKAVRKHDVVANTDDIHKGSCTRRLQPAQPLVKDTMTESTAGVRCEFSHHCRQLIKMALTRDHRVQRGIAEQTQDQFHTARCCPPGALRSRNSAHL